jgi:4-aminobutyrate aminotransferase/(S)-3-amino-2-methylpropionate transaminase
MTSNTDLLERRAAAVPRGIVTAAPIFAARAENSELWDVEGRRYIDFASGIAALNTGHRHPKVITEVEQQLGRFTHTAFQVVGYPAYVELAERLNRIAPVEQPAKTIFFTTGSEAVENAVKIARTATHKPAIIAFSGGFHGRTLMASTLTGKTNPYKRGFGPLPGEVYRLPFPVPHYGVSVEDSLRALDMLCRTDLEPERLAAIIIEPVQGEGGFHLAPPELLRALRAFCDKHGALLIADEIQSGFARTGRMFAIQHSGVQPDLVTVAKSLAGGLPLSGLIGRAEIMDCAEPGALGGTYGGPPLGCAAALAVLDVIEEENLCERAIALGEQVRPRLEEFTRRNDLIPVAGVRGVGAMLAFDLVEDRSAHRPDPAAAKAVTARALERGLILLSCGIYGETIRLLMPLTISDGLLREGLAVLEESLRVDL